MSFDMGRRPFNPNRIDLPPAEATDRPRGPLTVSQLTGLVKNALETSLPSTLHVVGEISNFKRHSSGHVYFTLKDRTSELACVMWRSAAASLKFKPEDGMEVIATGHVEVFERAGRYQLYARKLEPRGVGSLELAFRQLCERLQAEGLFDPRRKQPLPRYPSRIAIVTSPTGAAIADMLKTFERRFPGVHVLLYPVRVQGPGAADEIADAIRHLNTHATALGGLDVMIVGRGGGSLEDLWAFNEEPVARAIFASRIPIISAVGHEVDVTVADLTADVRAATPTAAAELAVPVMADLMDELAQWRIRLSRAMQSRTRLLNAELAAVLHRSLFREPIRLVQHRAQLLDELGTRLAGCTQERLRRLRRRIEHGETLVQRIAPHRQLTRWAVALRDAAHRLGWSLSRRLTDSRVTVYRLSGRMERRSPGVVALRLHDRLARCQEILQGAVRHRVVLDNERVRRQYERLSAMGYRNVLARGFSITRTKKGKQVVRSVSELRDGQRLMTEVSDGTVESEVVNREQLELFE